MVPWLLELTTRSDRFVLQDLTAQAVIEEVFADCSVAQFRFKVTQRQRVRSLCTQFNETDLSKQATFRRRPGCSLMNCCSLQG